MSAGIYVLLNIANGKQYIGSAVDFGRRAAHHKHKLAAGRHHNSHLQAAWTKYGSDVFIFKPLLLCAPKDLLFYEQRCLDAYKPEYNKCPVAGNHLGAVRGAETRARMSAAQKGNTHFKGKTHSLETRVKMSAAMRGIPKSPVHCAKIGARTFGTTRSVELRARISAKLMGIKRAPFSVEHRAKLAAAQLGRRCRVQ